MSLKKAAHYKICAAFFGAKSQLIELIRQNYNHPCIVTWEITNEITNTCVGEVVDEYPTNWHSDLTCIVSKSLLLINLLERIVIFSYSFLFQLKEL